MTVNILLQKVRYYKGVGFLPTLFFSPPSTLSARREFKNLSKLHKKQYKNLVILPIVFYPIICYNVITKRGKIKQKNKKVLTIYNIYVIMNM